MPYAAARAGPVLIEIPDEVWQAEYQGGIDYAPVAVQRSAPDPDAIRQAVRMLRQAKHPLLLAGQGVHYAEAGERLAALAELLAAPGAPHHPGNRRSPQTHPPATRSPPR